VTCILAFSSKAGHSPVAQSTTASSYTKSLHKKQCLIFFCLNLLYCPCPHSCQSNWRCQTNPNVTSLHVSNILQWAYLQMSIGCANAMVISCSGLAVCIREVIINKLELMIASYDSGFVAINSMDFSMPSLDCNMGYYHIQIDPKAKNMHDNLLLGASLST